MNAASLEAGWLTSLKNIKNVNVGGSFKTALCASKSFLSGNFDKYVKSPSVNLWNNTTQKYNDSRFPEYVKYTKNLPKNGLNYAKNFSKKSWNDVIVPKYNSTTKSFSERYAQFKEDYKKARQEAKLNRNKDGLSYLEHIGGIGISNL